MSSADTYNIKVKMHRLSRLLLSGLRALNPQCPLHPRVNPSYNSSYRTTNQRSKGKYVVQPATRSQNRARARENSIDSSIELAPLLPLEFV